MTIKKEFPDFDKMSYEEEAEFWDNADLTDYIDKGDIGKTKVVVKPRKNKDELVAFRMESDDLTELRNRAETLGIGYSTLLRILTKRYLSEDATSILHGKKSNP